MGRETADITYADTTGFLTEIFITGGYLDRDIWESERPTYYLEVKTTTRGCSEQFYMSGSQYQRVSPSFQVKTQRIATKHSITKQMQNMKLSPRAASPNVYVIFRVFDLEGRKGLRVYVDPESARLAGELDFNVDTWAVKTI